jgi:Protein of unknown function (DUF3187)
MQLKSTIIILLLLLLCSGGVLRATDVEFPLIQSMTYFPYSNHNTLAKKELRLSLDIAVSNVYMYDFERTTINDMETISSTFGAAYGLTDRITLEFYFRMVLAYGGIMDKLIVDFHNLFNLTEGGRFDFPRNQVNYSYKDAFAHSGSPMAISPLVLGALTRLYEKNNFRLNGRLTMGLPITPKRGFTSSKPFFTAGLIGLYETKTKKLSASWANHFSIFGKPNWLADEDIKKWIFHSELRVDYKRLFAGMMLRTTPFKESDLGNNAYIIYLGVKIWKYFELALVEEFPPMDTTPDVSFNLRIKLLGK